MELEAKTEAATESSRRLRRHHRASDIDRQGERAYDDPYPAEHPESLLGYRAAKCCDTCQSQFWLNTRVPAPDDPFAAGPPIEKIAPLIK